MADTSLLQDFITESVEHLEDMEAKLLKLESDPGNSDLLNDIFRSTHTIKGASEYMGIEAIAALAHKLENLLDMLRKGELALNSDVLDTLMAARDRIVLLIGDLELTQSEETTIEDVLMAIGRIMNGEDDGDEDEEEMPVLESQEGFWADSVDSDDDDEIIEDFISETKTYLQEMETKIGLLKENPENQEALNELFRAVHTIKGAADFMGIDHIASISRQLEAFLLKMRQEKGAPDSQTIHVIAPIPQRIGLMIEEMAQKSEKKIKIDDLTDAIDALSQESQMVEARQDESNATVADDDDGYTDALAEQEDTDLFDDEYDEEYDEELFNIFLEQLEENITNMHELSGELLRSESQFETAIEKYIENIQGLHSSANYMGYEKLTQYYEKWMESLYADMETRDSGEAVDWNSYIQINIIAPIKKLLSLFPRLQARFGDMDWVEEYGAGVVAESVDISPEDAAPDEDVFEKMIHEELDADHDEDIEQKSVLSEEASRFATSDDDDDDDDDVDMDEDDGETALTTDGLGSDRASEEVEEDAEAYDLDVEADAIAETADDFDSHSYEDDDVDQVDSGEDIASDDFDLVIDENEIEEAAQALGLYLEADETSEAPKQIDLYHGGEALSDSADVSDADFEDEEIAEAVDDLDSDLEDDAWEDDAEDLDAEIEDDELAHVLDEVEAEIEDDEPDDVVDEVEDEVEDDELDDLADEKDAEIEEEELADVADEVESEVEDEADAELQDEEIDDITDELDGDEFEEFDDDLDDIFEDQDFLDEVDSFDFDLDNGDVSDDASREAADETADLSVLGEEAEKIVSNVVDAAMDEDDDDIEAFAEEDARFGLDEASDASIDIQEGDIMVSEENETDGDDEDYEDHQGVDDEIDAYDYAQEDRYPIDRHWRQTDEAFPSAGATAVVSPGQQDEPVVEGKTLYNKLEKAFDRMLKHSLNLDSDARLAESVEALFSSSAPQTPKSISHSESDLAALGAEMEKRLEHFDSDKKKKFDPRALLFSEEDAHGRDPKSISSHPGEVDDRIRGVLEAAAAAKARAISDSRPPISRFNKPQPSLPEFLHDAQGDEARPRSEPGKVFPQSGEKHPARAPKAKKAAVKEAPKRRSAPKAAPQKAPASGEAPTQTVDGATDAITKKSIRVDAKKIDDLINQVGELVVSRAWFSQLYNEMRSFQQYLKESVKLDQKNMKQVRGITFRLSEATVALGRVANELQEGVMRVRMLPISQLFNRYPRLVRDLTHDIDKDVRLEVKGEETELDKMIIEEISDPLIHILRNAVDHGIETIEERRLQNKPEAGRLVLEAYHESNHVVIEISDDGCGIDPNKIKAAAIERKLMSSDELDLMSEKELIGLITAPGFSTAAQVTTTSGRGVGMDVVKKNIEKLNGTLEIDSKVGAYTQFRIKIPLTLAIIPALLVKVGAELYTIPLAAVEETLRIFRQDTTTIEGAEVIHIRDMTLPLVRLSKIFGISSRTDASDKEFVVIVSTGLKKIGLVVDALIGQEEVVIKPLEDYLQEKSGFSGATILGDGRISLILDVYELANLSIERLINKRKIK